MGRNVGARRILSFVLLVAMTISMLPISVFSATTDETAEGIRIVVTGKLESPTSNIIDMTISLDPGANKNPVSLIKPVIAFDYEVLGLIRPAATTNNNINTENTWLNQSVSNFAKIISDPVIYNEGEDDEYQEEWSIQAIGTARIGNTAMIGIQLIYPTDTNGGALCEGQTDIAMFRFKIRDGFTISDVNKNTIWLMNEVSETAAADAEFLKSIGGASSVIAMTVNGSELSYGDPSTDIIVSTDDETGENKYEWDTSYNNLNYDALALSYTRQNEDKPASVEPGKIEEDGSVTITAPVYGEIYSADSPLTVLSFNGGTDSGNVEDGTFTIGEGASAIPFTVVGGKVFPTTAIPEDFEGGSGKITIKGNGGSGTDAYSYTKEITINIPAVVYELSSDPAQIDVTVTTPATTVKAALDAITTGKNSHWTALTEDKDKETPEYTGKYVAEETALVMTAGIKADGSVAEDDTDKGIYFVPVYKVSQSDAELTNIKTAYGTVKFVVTNNPTDDIVDNLVSADNAYTSTAKKITFNDATNTEWQYVVVKKSDLPETVDAAYLATVTGWTEGDARDGVTFEGLTPATEYYLIVRNGTDNATAKVSATTASTKYGITVTSVEAAENADSVTSVTKTTDTDWTSEMKIEKAASGNVVTFSDSLEAETKAAEEAAQSALLTQVINLKNENGQPIKVTATVMNYDPNAEEGSKYTENTYFTATPSTTEAIAVNDDYKVTVAPTTQIAAGTSAVYVKIDAYDVPSEGEAKIVATEYVKLNLKVYVNRSSFTNIDLVLRPGSLKDASAEDAALLAKAGNAFKLANSAFESTPAPEYAKQTSGDHSADYDVLKGDDLQATYTNVTADVAGTAIDDNAFYLYFINNVDDLGTVFAVDAKYPQNETYLAQTTSFNVKIQGKISDILEGEDGKETATITTKYVKTKPADDATIAIDLTDGKATSASTTNNDAPAVGADNKTITINKDSKPGSYTYTVAISGSETYADSTVDVTVVILAPYTHDDLGAQTTNTGEAFAQTDHAQTDRYLVGNLLTADNNLDANDVTYSVDLADASIVEDGGSYYLVLDEGKGITEYTVIDVTMSVAQNETKNYGAGEVHQTIYVQKKLTLASASETTHYDLDKSSEVTLDVVAHDDTADANIATVSYTIKSGDKVIALSGTNNETLKPYDPTQSDVAYGEATITATFTDTVNTPAHYIADSIELTVNSRKDSDGPEPPDDPPYNGTKADIVGTDGTADYHKFSTTLTVGDDTYDSWPLSDGIKNVMFTNLKKGVAGISYEYRLLKNTGTAEAPVYEWEAWTAIPESSINPLQNGSQAPGYASDDDITAAGNVAIYARTNNIVSAQIRYAEGAGPITDEPRDPETNDIVIHGLEKNAGYEYQLYKTENGETTTEEWVELPLSGRVEDTVEALKADGLYQYTVPNSSDYTGANVRAATTPVVEGPNDDGDYIIKGLTPGVKYDIAPGVIDGTVKPFVDDPANYAQDTAINDGSKNGNGTITIYAASRASLGTLNVNTALADTTVNGGVLGVAPYTVREAQTETTLPGTPKPAVAGVSVKGQIRSYCPTKAATVYLIPQDASATKITVRNRDRSLNLPSVYYSAQTAVATRTDNNQHTDNFEIENVPAGTYTMVVVKQSHTDFVMRNFVVGTSDIDLSTEQYQFVDTFNLTSGAPTTRDLSPIVLYCGDANDNGTVNEDDIQRILVPANFGKDATTETLKTADVNGNGVVNEDDIQRVLLPALFGKTSVDISFTSVTKKP